MRSLPRDFSTIMENDIPSYFVDTREDLQDSPDYAVDEVELYDSAILQDRDPDPNNPAEIVFIEDQPDSVFLKGGIEIETGSLRNILKQSSFGAIDGSSSSISRQIISPVLARAAFGSYSHLETLPMHEIMEMDVNYLVSIDHIVKALNPKKVNKLSGKDGRGTSLHQVGTDLQADMEIASIKTVVDKFANDIDYLCLDGPLYYRNRVSDAVSSVDYAINEGVQMFSIVKRSQDDALSKHINYRASKHDILLSLGGWYHSDADFLSINLRKGYRTPFYTQINNKEKVAKLPDELKRVCSWLKLPSGKVCRIEIPYQLAGVDQQLEPAKDILRMVNKLSLENQGKLPLFLERADTRALISRNDTRNYAVIIDRYLRSLGLPTGDPDYWK